MLGSGEMRIFEVDVSGEDLLSKDYSICVADKDGAIKGFKFSEKLIKDLNSRYGQGFYRYSKSKKGKSDFKIRLYCVVVYYLFISFKISGDVSLNLCRDFAGRDKYIRKSLEYFLKDKLEIELCGIYFAKLSDSSNAHRYAGISRKDRKNKLNIYVNILLEDFEKWLK